MVVYIASTTMSNIIPQKTSSPFGCFRAIFGFFFFFFEGGEGGFTHLHLIGWATNCQWSDIIKSDIFVNRVTDISFSSMSHTCIPIQVQNVPVLQYNIFSLYRSPSNITPIQGKIIWRHMANRWSGSIPVYKICLRPRSHQSKIAGFTDYFGTNFGGNALIRKKWSSCSRTADHFGWRGGLVFPIRTCARTKCGGNAVSLGTAAVAFATSDNFLIAKNIQ